MAQRNAFATKSGAAFHLKRDRAISLDGSVFNFTVGDSRDRKRAIAEAQAAGDAHLARMEHQKGSKLSRLERTSGEFDVEPAASSPQSLKVKGDPVSNPYNIALQSELNRPALTPKQAGLQNRRIERLRELQQAKEAKILESKAAADFDAREDIANAREWIAARLETLRLDPKSSVKDIRNAERLSKLVEGHFDVDQFWVQADGLTDLSPKTPSTTISQQPLGQIVDAVSPVSEDE